MSLDVKTKSIYHKKTLPLLRPIKNLKLITSPTTSLVDLNNLQSIKFVLVPAVSSLSNNSAAGDKNCGRRHSDSEHFLPPRTPPVQESNTHSTSSIGQEKLTISKGIVKRASSDPGPHQSQRYVLLSVNSGGSRVD